MNRFLLHVSNACFNTPCSGLYKYIIERENTYLGFEECSGPKQWAAAGNWSWLGIQSKHGRLPQSTTFTNVGEGSYWICEECAVGMVNTEPLSQQMLKIKYMWHVANRTGALFFWWGNVEFFGAQRQLFSVKPYRLTFTQALPKGKKKAFFRGNSLQFCISVLATDVCEMKSCI